ncbi:MAG: PKD domain-containing protein [Nitrososphaerales archaeon]
MGASLPEFIIAKDPGESELQVEVRTDKSFYMIGEQVTVKFALNQKGYVYLLDIAPQADGKRRVTLIFPSREAPLNYLSEGEATYKSSSNDGSGFVQAIATPIPIPIVESLDATVLGDDPQAVKQEILRKIQARGISEGEWGASWANYSLSAFSPFSPTDFGELVVYVLDGSKPASDKNAHCPVTKDTREDVKLYRAYVYVDSSAKKIDPTKPAEGRLADPPESPFSRLTVEAGDRRVLATVPLEYQYSMTPKTVEPRSALLSDGRIRVPPTKDPAQPPVVACFELQPTPEGVTQFTFRPPTPKMLEEVTFDASRSRAVGYVWDFGDGSPIVIGGVGKAVVKHTYRLSGFYTAKLTAIYSSDKKGTCPPENKQTTESCEVSRTIQVPRIGPTIEVFELPGPVSLKRREGSAPPARAEQEIEITAREISEIAFKFHYNFKSFPFTETMVVGWGWLDADSDITVQITFLNEKGEVVGLPQRKRFCPLQTYKEAKEEGCTFRLPIGEKQSGSETLNFLDDELYRIGVNTAILDGRIRKVKFLVEVGLTIRRNALAQTANADIEVEYSDLQIVVRARR